MEDSGGDIGKMSDFQKVKRLAVWSGPRNLSTALMRSFSSRGDTVVSDEPFYAAYLERTGEEHPGREKILASQAVDWREVARELAEGAPPERRGVWMQKQMSKHMVPEMLGEWLLNLEHVFLLRHPGRVITSYLKVLPEMELADTGLPWQVALLDYIRRETGDAPPAIRAEDLRMKPEGTLRALCGALGLEWDGRMLEWEAGPHSRDGVWGEYWYGNTWATTGFDRGVTPEREPPVPEAEFFDEALEMHARLEELAIEPLTDY